MTSSPDPYGRHTLPSCGKKRSGREKRGRIPDFISSQRFAAAAGPGSTCPYCHALIPWPRCHGHRPENRSFSPLGMVPTMPPHLSVRPRRPAAPSPGTFPVAGRVQRTCAASGPDSGKPADGQPCRPAARGAPGRRARPGQTPGHCHWLDIAGGVGAGCRRSRAAGQPVLPSGPQGRDTGRSQRGADGRRSGTPPPSSRHTGTAHRRRPGVP